MLLGHTHVCLPSLIIIQAPEGIASPQRWVQPTEKVLLLLNYSDILFLFGENAGQTASDPQERRGQSVAFYVFCLLA